MKKVTAILALVGTLTLGLAAGATIDAKIERIQNAPAQERVKLMNEFKQELMTMNQEQRQEAVSKMQAEMQAAGKMTKTQTQERKREHVATAQAEATGEMNRHQNMNQKQMGSQAAQKFINSGGIIPSGATPNNTNIAGQTTVRIPTH